jgi:hypothetical protein
LNSDIVPKRGLSAVRGRKIIGVVEKARSVARVLIVYESVFLQNCTLIIYIINWSRYD